MKILVTGGAGFLGRSVIEFGTDAGHDMTSYDRAHGGDVLDTGNLRASVREVDHVIHLAGILGTSELFDDAHRAVQVNVGGALNVIEACAEMGAGYTTLTLPDSGWASVYAVTKRCAMDLAEAYRRHRGLRTSNVCAYNAYGPRQKHGAGHPQKIIPTFASRAWAGQPIEIWGNGEQTVDLVHTDDIARMLVAATAFSGGEIFDAGTGHAMTVFEVAGFVTQVVAEASGNEPVGVEYLPMRAGEDMNTLIVATGRGWGQLPQDVIPKMDFDRLRETILSYQPMGAW